MQAAQQRLQFDVLEDQTVGDLQVIGATETAGWLGGVC